MLLCKSAIAAESLMHLLGTHLNRTVQGVTANTAQAEGAFIFFTRCLLSGGAFPPLPPLSAERTRRRPHRRGRARVR